ncbi:MAG: hypothetical protein GY855_15295, partial [candidate division Zixibacteria bacterium]|nr:hypothetical protein [candidate division Zixibacteria bacterium]
DQQNSDTDEFGDVCDNCVEVDGPCCDDYDDDGFGDACDNCPQHHNPFQQDSDDDGIGNICDYLCGDFDGDLDVNIVDIVFLINYKYKGDAAPYPLDRMDANADTLLDIRDIVYLINYKYKGGPEPICLLPL